MIFKSQTSHAPSRKSLESLILMGTGSAERRRAKGASGSNRGEEAGARQLGSRSGEGGGTEGAGGEAEEGGEHGGGCGGGGEEGRESTERERKRSHDGVDGIG